MIDSTLLTILAAFAFTAAALGTWRREPPLVLAGGILLLVSGAIAVGEGIGQTQTINVSIANVSGNISQWSNSTTTFVAGPAVDRLVGLSFVIVGLFLLLSEAARSMGRPGR